tara:strand:- start:396957 stop:397304 length:348 start_codon:yes stop_codon:yes gene_type:complete
MTSHLYTPSHTELPGLLSGEVTEVWVRMDKQPDEMLQDIPYARSYQDELKELDGPPYAVGDVLVVLIDGYTDQTSGVVTVPIRNHFSLAIAAITPQQRDGVWGWEIATTKETTND